MRRHLHGLSLRDIVLPIQLSCLSWHPPLINRICGPQIPLENVDWSVVYCVFFLGLTVWKEPIAEFLLEQERKVQQPFVQVGRA